MKTNKTQHITQKVSIIMTRDLKARIEKIIWTHKNNNKRINQAQILLQYIEEGVDRAEKELKDNR